MTEVSCTHVTCLYRVVDGCDEEKENMAQCKDGLGIVRPKPQTRYAARSSLKTRCALSVSPRNQHLVFPRCLSAATGCISMLYSQDRDNQVSKDYWKYMEVSRNGVVTPIVDVFVFFLWGKNILKNG